MTTEQKIDRILEAVQARPAAPLVEALRAVSRDMHTTSTRPCATCRAVTALLGEPFGCDAYRAQRATRSAA